ncbi:MAG: hypothetical protein H6807_17535 [Planctomycetes bacterium]|nr:hypothetical protein [Planctomycetota bacterium]
MPAFCPFLATEPPPWLDRLMHPVVLGLLGFVALWLLLSFLSYWHRRTYNLTKAETTSVKVKDKPAFLKVDHEARAAAIKRGDDYVRPDDAAAAAEAAGRAMAQRPNGWLGRFLVLVRVATVLFAATNLCLMIGSCLNLIDGSSQDFASMPAVDRWRIIVNEYWLPLITSLAVLAAQALAFMRGERKNKAMSNPSA